MKASKRGKTGIPAQRNLTKVRSFFFSVIFIDKKRGLDKVQKERKKTHQSKSRHIIKEQRERSKNRNSCYFQAEPFFLYLHICRSDPSDVTRRGGCRDNANARELLFSFDISHSTDWRCRYGRRKRVTLSPGFIGDWIFASLALTSGVRSWKREREWNRRQRNASGGVPVSQNRLLGGLWNEDASSALVLFLLRSLALSEHACVSFCCHTSARDGARRIYESVMSQHKVEAEPTWQSRKRQTNCPLQLSWWIMMNLSWPEPVYKWKWCF